MDFLDYPGVSMEVKGAMSDGRLKLTDEKLIFKSTKSGKTEHVDKSDIEIVNWQRLAGSWGIRIFTKDEKLHRFAGFRDTDRERLAKFFSQTYQIDMLDRELSVKGWNWGTAKFNGSVLGFEIGDSDAFEIPLDSVQQCVTGRNEVTLEFHGNDDAAVNLSEVRFHIPGSELAGEDPVDAFKEHVMKMASVMTTSGDAIAIFSEISCLSPRGRYTIKIFPTYIHMHGKTFDYKIPASSMIRLFLLPHKDGRQMHFAVNCDPPIKQGQTRYHYLVFNFNEEDEEDVELPMTEEEIKEKYDGKLEKQMSGKSYEVISKLLKTVVGRKITVPKDFVGHSGTSAITCSHKASSGFLYPLERGIIYIYKPPIYVRYDEIGKVEFERTGGTSRSFDVKITNIHDIPYTFSSIEKGEYGKLYDYLKSKQLKVLTSGKLEGGLTWDDGKHAVVDHYLVGVQKEAEEFSAGSDDMSSDDTDFNPDALEALSAKEEYDSEPSTTSSEDDESDAGGNDSETEARRAEKAKKKAEKKAARERRKKEPKEKKVKKVKKTKLPGQPKRNQSAYFLWMNENRDNIKRENPGLSITEFGKKAGELWKGLSDKTEWEKRASEDKKRYDRDMDEWKKGGGAEAIASAKKAAKRAKNVKKKEEQSSVVVDSKAGTGGHFKSKEFIDESSSKSSDSEQG